MLSNTPITSCPALPLPHMSHFSRAHPYPSVLFSPYLCLCSFSFAWKPLPTILCWPHSSTSCKSSSGPPPQEALHDWLPPLPAASTYSPLRLWPVGNRSQSAGHVSLRCTDHFVVGLSVFPASWGRCLTLMFLVPAPCLAFRKLRSHPLHFSELHGLDRTVLLSWVIHFKWSAKGLGWEERKDDQASRAAESTLVIKRKTHVGARLPSSFRWGRAGQFDPGASEQPHFKMEMARPCSAALS